MGPISFDAPTASGDMIARPGSAAFDRALGLAERIETVPLSFGDDPPLLGMLTVPVESSSGRRGVVLCAPLYHQNICSYRPVRNLAVRIAERGLPAFRFDWPGCGDSGDAPDPSLAT